MPIKSYLAYPKPGRKEELAAALEQLAGCEVRASDNAEVVILVTDTATEEAETDMERQIQAIPALATLSLVCGYADDPATPWNEESS